MVGAKNFQSIRYGSDFDFNMCGTRVAVIVGSVRATFLRRSLDTTQKTVLGRFVISSFSEKDAEDMFAALYAMGLD